MNTMKAARGLSLSYPFAFEATEDFSDYQRDDHGIPKVYYPHLKRWEYNPITISQLGLHLLSLFEKNGDIHAAQLAKTMADWLLENLEEWQNGIAAWVYHFDLPFYGPAEPWISGMAQGQAISLLLRMSLLGNRTDYEAACRRAIKAFYAPVSQGGVQEYFADGTIIFEEYPTAEPSKVLNGHLFALIGLHDYAVYFDDDRVRGLFDECANGLKNNLSLYDTGFWNLYDLHATRRLASPDYVRIHIQLLNILTKLTKDEFFVNKAKKWEGYLNSPLCRLRFYVRKLIEKIRLRFF